VSPDGNDLTVINNLDGQYRSCCSAILELRPIARLSASSSKSPYSPTPGKIEIRLAKMPRKPTEATVLSVHVLQVRLAGRASFHPTKLKRLGCLALGTGRRAAGVPRYQPSAQELCRPSAPAGTAAKRTPRTGPSVVRQFFTFRCNVRNWPS
jgi:hypothetical protein